MCEPARGILHLTVCEESGLCRGGREFSVKVCLCRFVCKEVCVGMFLRRAGAV